MPFIEQGVMAQHDGHILMPPYVGMSHAMIVAVPSNWPVGLPGTIPENHHDNNIRLPAAASSASFHRELYRRRRSFKGRAVMFFSHLRRAMWSPIHLGSLNSSGG